jgi:hypothetical protein
LDISLKLSSFSTLSNNSITAKPFSIDLIKRGSSKPEAIFTTTLNKIFKKIVEGV